MIEEQQAVVRQALAQMPEKFREPLILFYREGRSTREVAGLLGLSENAARQRISRGRGLLREQVADMIEATIARTKPGKTFTTAVIASIAALGMRGSATAMATGAAYAAAGGGSFGAASILSSLTAKATAVAVGAVVIVAGIVTYTQFNRAAELPRPTVGSPVRQERSEQAPTVLSIAEAREAGAIVEIITGRVEAPGVAAAETEDNPQPSANDTSQQAADEREGPFEFQPRGVLSGRITDIVTGEPVRSARLTISMGRIYTAQTDDNGFYSLEKIDQAGNYDVSISSNEYLGSSPGEGSLSVHLRPDAQIVRHLQLPRACMVDVWVVDANGVGIKDARVVGTSLADDRKREVNRSIYSRGTDPNGYILLGGFPPADTDYLITAWHTVQTGSEERGGRRYTRSECDYAPTRATIRLTDPNVIQQVHIVLERGQPVQAQVEYEDGVPAANVELGFVPAWWHCLYGLPIHRTDTNGMLTLKHIVAGLYDVSLYTPMGASGYTSRKIMQAQLPPVDGEPLVIRLAGKSPQVQVSISGSLIYRGEKRPAHMRIVAVSAGGTHTYGVVNHGPDGRSGDTFTIDGLEPGIYRLTFSGENIEETTVSNVVAPSSDVQVELVYVAKPALAGIMVDARTGEPIRDFRIRIRKLRSLRGPSYVQPNRWVHFENERGEFSAEPVGPGIYQVQAVARGYASAWSELLNTDEPSPVLIGLSAGGAISGRVIDEKGEPVSGAKVIPLSLAGGTMSQTEDMFVDEEGAVETVGGAFTLSHVPAGTETLKVVHSGHAPHVTEGIPVVAGRITEGIEITLPVGGTVEGYVYDLQGRPQAGQVLYFQDARTSAGSGDDRIGRLGQAITDANGFYRVDHLPQQLCHVRRMDQQQPLGVIRRMVVPRNGQVVRVDLGGLPVVQGRVVLDGVPLAKARLLIGPTRSPHFGTFTCYALTDERGFFTFGGAPPDTYSIHYQRPGELGRWLSLGTVTVATADVDVGTMPANVGNLFVTVNDAGAGWPIDSVFLGREKRLWSTPVGISEAPSKPGGPCAIRSVEPGTYILNVRRQDQVVWQKPIELEPGRSRWEISLDLPTWTAGVSGRIRNGGGRTFVLWREQRDVFAVLMPGPGGACHVRHLPAGRYFVGDISSMLYPLPAIAELHLSEGQEKPIDLDLPSPGIGRTGYVLVQVVDETGRLHDAAQVHLEGPLGPAESTDSEDTGQGRGFLTSTGEHTLHVQAPGYRAVTRRLTVRPFDPDIAQPQTVVICLDR
jgi:hypothetical protein